MKKQGLFILIAVLLIIGLVFSTLPDTTAAGEKKKEEKSEYFNPPEGTPEEAIKLVGEAAGILDDIHECKDRKKIKSYLRKMISRLKKAKSKAPKWVVPDYYLSIAYQGQEKYKTAKTAIEIALKKHPKWHEALIELGDIHNWLKEHDKAMDTFNQIIKLKPDYAVVYSRRAFQHVRNRDLKKAHADMKKYLELDGPKDDKEKEQYDKIVEAIEKEMAMGSKWTQTYTKESEHYIIKTSVSQDFADKVSKQIEVIYKAYTKIFPKNKIKGKRDKFKLFLHNSKQQYVAAGAPDHSGGYFSPLSKQVVCFKYPNFDAGLAVLYHECFHQYLDTYLPNPPLWYNEGHAEFYGAFLYLPERNGMQYRPNGTRLPTAKQMIQRKMMMPLKDLVRMTNEQFYEEKKMAANYAQAWAFIYFLYMYQNGRYKSYMKKYFKYMQKGLSYDECADKVFRKVNWDQWEREFRQFIISQKEKDASPPMSSGGPTQRPGRRR